MTVVRWTCQVWAINFGDRKRTFSPTMKLFTCHWLAFSITNILQQCEHIAAQDVVDAEPSDLATRGDTWMTWMELGATRPAALMQH